MKTVILIFLSLFFNLCISKIKFEVPYKIYDFLQTQPGFNLNYSIYSSDESIKKTGLVKTLLNPITHKPDYCCGNNPFNYIANQNEFDQSFKETQGVTKTLIKTFSFNDQLYIDQRSIYYVMNEMPYHPIDGEGWNERIEGENRFWCIEGHYKFIYKTKRTTKYFYLFGSGDVSVFIDGKLAIEFSGVDIENARVDHTTLNLQEGNSYTFDYFMCQRFDVPGSHISFITPFVFECNNIPGVNDDVCAPKCNVEKDCNDNNPCTVDACPSPSTIIPQNESISNYCTHTPVQCNENSNKCAQNTCNIKNGKCEPLPQKKCPPKPLIGALGIGVICQPYKCEPSSGNCTIDSSKSLLSQLLCSI
ncbi:hypothetical protein ACTA71_005613 [Dictyostelium dimigraforme]